MLRWLCLALFTCVVNGDKSPFKDCSPRRGKDARQNYRALNEQQLVCKMLSNYDPAIRPRGFNQSGAPVIIRTSVHLKSISAVNVANMQFLAQFLFLQEWFDERLAFHDDRHVYGITSRLYLASDQRIWVPDTFFQNEKSGWYHDVDRPNKYFRIREDGNVLYSRRLTMTFTCIMDLHKYPLDTQYCPLEFASYAYTTDDIVYEWENPPVNITNDAAEALPNFFITHIVNSSCTSKTNTGSYSCLRVQLHLQRAISYFVLQFYAPTSMLVGVSWVSYWIDWKVAAARVPLATVTLLAIIGTSQSMNSKLPPVSYTKAIDIWINACVVFVFSAVIEYAAVNYTGLRERARLAKEKLKEKANEVPMASTAKSPYEMLRLRHRESARQRLTIHDISDDEHMYGRFTRSNQKSWTNYIPNFGLKKFIAIYKRTNSKAERIDIISRLAAPLVFVIFGTVYWIVFLTLV